MVETGTDDAGLRLGALLRKLRKDAGKKLETLSRELDRCEGLANEATSVSSLSRIENGGQTPTEAVVKAILTATGANPKTARQALLLVEQIMAAPNTPPPVGDTEQPPGKIAPELCPEPPLSAIPRPVAPPLAGRPQKRWMIATVVALGVAGAVLAVTQPWASGAGSPCTPPASTEAISGTPSSTAVSSDSAAYAEFYRDQGRFVLADKRADSRSAVLLVRVNGKPQQPWSNCYGKTGRRRSDGIIAPPKIIQLPGFDKNATIEFSTCAAESATQIIEVTCGPWTIDQPA